ncbi:MAG: pyruvate, phosphate dikinase [Alphaproteobacteria bacterium]
MNSSPALQPAAQSAPQYDKQQQWVYRFSAKGSAGSAKMRDLLGGKGANLAEMCNMGLPVPPGFTISTDLCRYFYANGKQYPENLAGQVEEAVAFIAEEMADAGIGFGNAAHPLLVSVRSGARDSMPGMMDTVLNLGLNDQTVEGLAAQSQSPRFAYDSYRRFIQMFGNVVLDMDHHDFEEVLDEYKLEKGYVRDTDMQAADWQAVVSDYKKVVKRVTGKDFPQDPHQQLWAAIGAVFNSWMNARAVTYRRLHDISEDGGTAVTVQAMVFGNMGDDCATGVAFTRNPSTGTKEFYGEYLLNAQGEDVVAGIRTPQHLTKEARLAAKSTALSMEETMPVVFKQLAEVRLTLETHYRDMQDIEFTVQRNKLFMLQTRNGKRTAAAALKIAVDLAEEGLLSREEAVMRVNPASLDQLLHPAIDTANKPAALAKGLPASPGAACGKIVFLADKAEKMAAQGEKVILCRHETSPEDIHGMYAAVGILTSRGGMTSHAAVVARGMGKPCVAGASDVRIDMKQGKITAGGQELKEGDYLTIDGGTGEIMAGQVATRQPELTGAFGTLMGWADSVRTMKVRTNAETARDAEMARRFGAEGIGLCRTEHMFFDADRLPAMREMILAQDETGRRAALAKLAPMQKADFVQLFSIMKGLPVTIRLLDPPLHEFLPHTENEMAELAATTGLAIDEIRARCASLSELNPMLGHRGCRLGVTYPEIYEMQAQAIIEAAVELKQKDGETVIPEIMIPLVATKRELDVMKAVVVRAAEAVKAASGVTITYQVGTMIELPRAALKAGEIAETAEFFSFGTNDLTQTTLGISRDDSARFLQEYQRQHILSFDPFATLDVEGVGELITIATTRGRATRPNLKLGICGEHGGDPASIRFCASVGLDYVSCSPFRVPVARLAAAQAALNKELNLDK